VVAIVCGVIIGIVLIATSFSKLEAYEVGLEYNPNSITINENRLFTEGTFFLGPGHSFIKFNKQMRTVLLGDQGATTSSTKPDVKDDALVCRTKDALLVEIEISFQYLLSISMDNLLDLYHNWGEDYENAFILLARNQLRDTMAQFEALQVFYDRSTIEAALRAGLQNRLSAYHADM
jgi:hypothetical protein